MLTFIAQSIKTKELILLGVTCRSVSCTQSPVTSPFHRPQYIDHASPSISTSMPPALDYCNLQNTLSPESENEGFQVKFVVTSSSTMLPGKRSIVIGSLPVPRRASWEELDRVTQSIFTVRVAFIQLSLDLCSVMKTRNII